VILLVFLLLFVVFFSGLFAGMALMLAQVRWARRGLERRPGYLSLIPEYTAPRKTAGDVVFDILSRAAGPRRPW